jgi:hypothetical protein
MSRLQVMPCLLLVLAVVGACKSADKKVSLPGEDKVLAKVGASSITQYDVDRTARETFGKDTAAQLDPAVKKRLLESLVQARAIAQAREKELAPVEVAEVDRKVAAYREEVLVRQYLEKHTRQNGVNGDMVREYYEAHKDQFGGSKVRSYELLTSKTAVSETQRTALIQVFATAAKEQDWTAFSAKLERAGQPVALRREQSDAAALHPKLARALETLAVGQTSNLILVDGVPYVARVTSERELPAKPLAEVSAEIRKTLVPIKLKEAVKQASNQVMKNTEVAYR